MPLLPRRSAGHVVAALAAIALLAGCSSASTAAEGAPSPRLADVTPLTEPRTATCPSTARIDAASVDPITTGTQSLPASVVDAQGTAVTVTDTSRILALDLYGSTSRLVFELGLGDSVVGRDVSSDFAEIADRPLVTQNGHDLNAEAILDLAPTVLLTDSSLGPWDTVLQMRDAGIPVVVVGSDRSIATIPTLVGEVAAALGVPERGAELTARLSASVDETIARIDAVAPADPAQRLRIVFLYVRGQSGVYYLFGEGSGADDLVRSLGGIDVAAEIGWEGMRPLTDEGLVAAAPDLVLMMTGGLESVDGVDGLLEAVPALAQTPAGQNRRIVDMADTQILSFGPDTPRTLEALAVAIYAPDSTR
ncbi:heme/hemin ABC transporter substrate-binding protein [Rathayibacter sp. Leaf296]|uniref:heme/hemin ABC transporter substrate-binding protein n=1 Tax=Rathayibacter sp. Leaf296 TaxID=1736327 RepID=UPI000702453F|nr:ABC transporter substrate-binding protein [Rathayibacter sp. Leaf296]KQQ09762.1 hemin receptor [Rathayibacter sp. Leaf296]